MPLQGSSYVPAHCPVGQPVAGVQQTSWLSELPESGVGQICGAMQLSVHEKTFPLHGSWYVPAHWFAGQPVAGVQHMLTSVLPASASPQIWGDMQLFVGT